MRRAAPVTLIKSGNRLVIDPSTPAVCSLLEPQLSFTAKRFLYGVERIEKQTRLELIDYAIYGRDHRNRLTTSLGFRDRITRVLQQAGYDPIIKDLDQRPPDLFEPLWDRLYSGRFQLRPGQEEFLIKFFARVNDQNPARFDCPTGWGKSWILALLGVLLPTAKIHICSKRVPVLCERIYPALCRVLPDVGIVGGGNRSNGHRVQLYTFDSLHHSSGDADILIVDECFPAGTLVDGRPIETICAGDHVWAWSETGGIELKRVVRTFKRINRSVLVRLTLADGRVMVCTDNHPVWVYKSGFCPASTIHVGQRLYVWESHYGLRENRTMRRLSQTDYVRGANRLESVQIGAASRDALLFDALRLYTHAAVSTQSGEGSLSHLRKTGSIFRSCTVESFSSRCFLLSREEVWRQGNSQAHAGTKSDAFEIRTAEGIAQLEENGPSATGSRRQWSRANRARESLSKGHRPYAPPCDSDANGSWLRVSAGLQSGLGTCAVKTGSRSRRGLALCVGSATAGSQEDGQTSFVRVDRVEIFQPGDSDQSGSLCPDGFVYNLEVEENHTYFANGILVHNCHEAASDDAAEQLGRYDRSINIGLSATHDMRLDNKDLRTEAMFGPVVYKMDYAEAVKHGMVVPIEVQWANVIMDVDPCGSTDNPTEKKRHGIWRNEVRNQLIANDARRYGPDVQVLISCETIEHALHLKKLLPEFEVIYAANGIKPGDADYFHRLGVWPDDHVPMTQERLSQLTALYERGKLKKAIVTTVWNVGVDFTYLSVLCRADAGGSPINDTQIPGRTSRTNAAISKGTSTIHDYLDQFNTGFRTKAQKRRKSYAAHGWKQMLPGQREGVDPRHLPWHPEDC